MNRPNKIILTPLDEAVVERAKAKLDTPPLPIKPVKKPVKAIMPQISIIPQPPIIKRENEARPNVNIFKRKRFHEENPNENLLERKSSRFTAKFKMIRDERDEIGGKRTRRNKRKRTNKQKHRINKKSRRH
jgi:hypothetical protein